MVSVPPSRDRFCSRRSAVRILLILAALAPIGGCDCSSTNPVTPVILPPLSAVALTPDTDTLRVGTQQQFSAVAYDTLGHPVAGAGFTWSSGNAGIFTVTPNGKVTGIGEGVAWLYAQAGGLKDSSSIVVYPDSGWIVQTSNTARNLNAVFFRPEGREGWAVGDGGMVVHTTDAGITWRAQTGPTTANLNGVFFADPDTGFAVGNGGTILQTFDHGDHWKRLTVTFGENLNAVSFANRDTGFAVGSSGAVVRTVNGGRNWTKQNLTAITLRGVAFAGTHEGWAVGDGGDIWGTIDAGVTWSRISPSVTNATLRAVARRSTLAAWAVGAQGAAPFTTDVSGQPVWQNDNLGTLYDLHGLHFPSDVLTGYAVGFNATGSVLKTEDGGLSWSPQISNTGRQLNAVYFVDTQRGWAVGTSGTIIHTALGGR